jgi:hypothetical protein
MFNRSLGERWHLSPKERLNIDGQQLNSDGQQLHQYLQNKQPPLT